MPEVLENNSKTFNEKLVESVMELFETEKTYVTRLMTTYKIYVVEGQKYLTPSDSDQIFSNLDEILIASDNFYNDLISKCDPTTGKGIGEVFIKHIPNFSVYLIYCKNQTSSIKYLQRKMKDPHFSEFIKISLSRPECCGLDLASFLLEPVQRLTRYPMILKQIFKYTPNPSEECNLLAIAIEESENLLNRVNRAMLEGEEFEKLTQLQRRLSSHGKFLHTEHHFSSSCLPENFAGLTRNYGERKLLKSGLWIKLRSRRKLLVFLFSDFLLLTEAASRETDLRILDEEDEKLKIYRKPIHLDDIWSMKEPELSKIPSSYQNSSEYRGLEIEAHDSQPLFVHLHTKEYDSWIDSIAAAKRKLKSTPTGKSTTSNSSPLLGSVRLTVLTASSLPPDSSFYLIISHDDADRGFSTNHSPGPVAYWNQTFSLPIRTSKTEIKIEILKYDQYNINESIAYFKIPFEFITDTENSETASMLSDSGIELKLNFQYIPKNKQS